MLRTVGIPTRVVTGFASGIYNPISGRQIIRASDAHSWVEAWLPERGWMTLDATPADPTGIEDTMISRLSLWMDAAAVFWQTGFSTTISRNSSRLRRGWKNRAGDSVFRHPTCSVFRGGPIDSIGMAEEFVWRSGMGCRLWWSRLR